MRNYLFILITLLASPSLFAQASISLAPTESFLKGLPGSSVSQEFTVINDGAVSYLLTCLFNDIWFEGEKTVTGELGSQKVRQAGYQLQCSPNRILVPPKYVQKIKVVGLIPKDQEGERYARFYSEMLPPESLNEGATKATRATIGYSAKVGALITLTAQGTEKVSAEILDLSAESTKRFQIIKFKIKNNGNVHLAGSGTILITDEKDKSVGKVPVTLPFLYPGQTKTISFNLMDQLRPGKYKAILSISASTNESSLVKDFGIEIK